MAVVLKHLQFGKSLLLRSIIANAVNPLRELVYIVKAISWKREERLCFGAKIHECLFRLASISGWGGGREEGGGEEKEE